MVQIMSSLVVMLSISIMTLFVISMVSEVSKRVFFGFFISYVDKM